MIRDGNARCVGGLIADEQWGWLSGCLSTFEFQALPFYEEHGYSTFGTLEDFPTGTGFCRFFMRKNLRDAMPCTPK
jgi:hypothetical protein